MCEAEIEPIPDADTVHRHIDQPISVTSDGRTIVDKTFPLSQDSKSKRRYESLIWSKYAATPVEVHQLGLDRVAEGNKRRGPEREPHKYFGYGTAVAGEVRAKKTGRGYGFTITHHPTEVRAHAEIDLTPPDGKTLNKLLPNDRTEIIEFLSVIFFGNDDTKVTRYV